MGTAPAPLDGAIEVSGFLPSVLGKSLPGPGKRSEVLEIQPLPYSTCLFGGYESREDGPQGHRLSEQEPRPCHLTQCIFHYPTQITGMFAKTHVSYICLNTALCVRAGAAQERTSSSSGGGS